MILPGISMRSMKTMQKVFFEILYEPVGGSDKWDNGETANSAQSTTIAVEYAAGAVGGWFEAKPTQKMMDIFRKERAANGEYDYRTLTSVAWDYPGCMYYMEAYSGSIIR